MPSISVAVITYNHGAYIGEALESIVSQAITADVEVVVGDDCSPDDTADVVRRFAEADGRVRLVAHPRNLGAAGNINETLRACRGDFIAIMDGDDLMLPGKLEKQLRFLTRHPDHVLVGHALEAFDDEDGSVLRIVEPSVTKSEYDLTDLLRRGSILGNSSKMFRRSAMPSTPVHPEIRLIADMYLTLGIVGNARFGCLPEVLGRYRVHGGGFMRNLRAQEVLADIELTLAMVTEAHGDRFEPLYRYRRAYGHLLCGMEAMRNGELAKGRACLRRSLQENPLHAPSQWAYLALSYMPAGVRRRALKRLSSR